MASRKERLAANEARFREINDAAEPRRRESGGRYVCECANSGCVTWVELASDDYARIRENPRRFLIAPSHATPDVERIVESHDTYSVVEKPDEVAHIVDRDQT